MLSHRILPIRTVSFLLSHEFRCKQCVKSSLRNDEVSLNQCETCHNCLMLPCWFKVNDTVPAAYRKNAFLCHLCHNRHSYWAPSTVTQEAPLVASQEYISRAGVPPPGRAVSLRDTAFKQTQCCRRRNAVWNMPLLRMCTCRTCVE